MNNKTKKKGFTIVELVIVIGVIAILAAVLIPTFTSVTEKANKSAAMQEARNEYEMYLAENAENLTGTEHFYVVNGDYMFEVVNAQFNSDALDKDDTKYDSTADLSMVDGKDIGSADVAIYAAK